MGLTASVSSSAAASSSAATSLLSPVGAGVGGIFVAAALILLLAYFDLLGAADGDYARVRTMVIGAIAPLLVTFGAIVLFQSMSVLA